MAGQEKGKLAIQPIGSLVLEYLLHHFDTFFSYGYTESMESELDKIARLTSKDATEKWHHICRTCLDQIEEKMKPLKTAKKQTFPLDNPEYELVFNSYGISIKHTLEDGSKEYLSIKPGIEIDLEKAKRCEYTLSELADTRNPIIGVKDGHNVLLKTGKYGAYVEWGTNTKSIKRVLQETGKTLDEIGMEDVFTEEDGDNPDLETSSKNAKKEKSVLRELTPDLSIRIGRYGEYIYYKTEEMSKPAFYKLNYMKDRWRNSDTLSLLQWIKNTYKLDV